MEPIQLPPEGELTSIHNNSRHHLYRFRDQGNHYVMKIFLFPEGRPLRALGYRLKCVSRNPAARSFRGAQLLLTKGIPAPEPVQWGYRLSNRKRREPYVIFKFLDAHSITTLPYSQQRKIAAFLSRAIHEQGLLHGDLAINNFMIDENGLNQGYVIDTDNIRTNPLRGTPFRALFEAKCFRRIEFPWSTNPRFQILRFLYSYLKQPSRRKLGLYLRLIDFWRWRDAS